MPVSKRRKPKPQRLTKGMPPRAADAHFRQLAQMDGTTYTNDQVEYRPTDHTVRDQNPFTIAWDTAAETDSLVYAEGVVWRDETGWRSHAWCMTSDGAPVEVTAGFDDVRTYKGWEIPTEDAVTINGGTDAPTQSILATGLANGGAQYAEMLTRITRKR